MFTKNQTIVAVLICLAVNPVTSVCADSTPLQLVDAERLALMQDHSAPAMRASAAALEARAVAASQLPDPKLKLGAMNFPTDSLDRDQEPMTQLQVGVQQAFPPGKVREAKRLRTEAMAHAGSAKADAEVLAVIRDTRLAYLELRYQLQARQVVDESRRLFDQLVDVAESHYATGRQNQQDVLRANVELALLDDRATRIRTAQDRTRAELARRIGTDAERPLAEDQPRLPAPPGLPELREALGRHPMMQMENSKVAAGQSGVAEARARYRPNWMLDLTYGDRSGENLDGSERSDFVSAMVVLDLPLFTGKRQDQLLAAEQQNLSAAQLTRDDRYRELLRMLEADYAEWRRLGERLERYARTVIPQATQTTESSLTAYQSGISNFNALMRARLTELDSRLTALRLQADRDKAQARLLYLAGEQQ